MDNERCHHRFEVPGARLRGPTLDAPIINLSKTGLAILSDRELLPGEPYSAWLEAANDRSRVVGEVVWCAPLSKLQEPESRTPDSFEVGLSVRAIEPGSVDLSRLEPEPVTTRPVPAARGIRSAPRLKVSGMRLRASDLEAEVIDFSSRGLGVHTDRPLVAGTTYTADLETRDGTISVEAVVAWCEPEDGSEVSNGRPGYAAGLSLRHARQQEPGTGSASASRSVEPEPIAAAKPAVPSGAGVSPWLLEVTEGADTEADEPSPTAGWRWLIGGLSLLGALPRAAADWLAGQIGL